MLYFEQLSIGGRLVRGDLLRRSRYALNAVRQRFLRQALEYRAIDAAIQAG